MNIPAILKQAEAALIANEAARASLEALVAQLAPEEEPPCDHPLDSRRDLSTMGHEHWICGRCGYEHDQKVGE